MIRTQKDVERLYWKEVMSLRANKFQTHVVRIANDVKDIEGRNHRDLKAPARFNLFCNNSHSCYVCLDGT